jgi:hypothetical protein
MVAVAYHNLAVAQLALENFQQACVSSQNARRLARLSLSYSNGWMLRFDATHKAALLSATSSKQMKSAFGGKSQQDYFSRLEGALHG